MTFYDNSVSHGRALVRGLSQIDTEQLRDLAKKSEVYELPLRGRCDEQVPLKFSEYKGLSNYVAQRSSGQKFVEEFVGALSMMSKELVSLDGFCIDSALFAATVEWAEMKKAGELSPEREMELKEKLEQVLTVVAGYRDFAEGLLPGASDYKV